MSTQIEILLKARDEATKQIQTAFKNAEQSLTQFNVVAGQTGKTLQKAGKEVSGFNQYMREGRTENRQFGFVMREVMDIVGGAALMIKLFGGNSSNSEKQAKRLSESVMMGYIAFQATETVVSLTTAGFKSLRVVLSASKVATDSLTAAQIASNAAAKANVYMLIAQALVAVGVALYAYFKNSEEATKQQEELNKKIEEFNNKFHETKKSINAIRHELGQLTDKEFKDLLEAEEKYAKQQLNNAQTASSNAIKERKDDTVKAELKNKAKELELTYFQAVKATADFQIKLNKPREDAAKKELEIALAKNKSLIDLQESLERKKIELIGTMGLEGHNLKIAQLGLEEKALRESIEKQFTGRKENNELYKQALDELNNYIVAKYQQITIAEQSEVQKRNDEYTKSRNSQRISDDEANAKQVENFILSLNGELAATMRNYDEMEDLAKSDEDKAKIRAAKQIAIDKHIQDEKIKGFKQASQLVNEAVGLMVGFANQGSEQQITNITRERDLKLESINKQLEAEGLSEEQRAILLAKKQIIEDETNQKIKNEKTKMFKDEKAAAIVQGIMNTAIAVVEALPNIPLSVAVGILGAAQVALIASQPVPSFHKGGSAFVNAPASQEGFLPIKVRGQETVRVNTESQEANRGGVTINFNSPVSDTQFVTNSIKKVLNQSGLSLDKAFANQRNVVSL